MGPPYSDRVTRVRPYSGFHPATILFAYGSFTLFALTFQSYSAKKSLSFDDPNPKSLDLVWPLSRSLAATWEIAVAFSSYRYVDVSVPCVTLFNTTLFILTC